MSMESISSMRVEAGAGFWLVVQMIWFEGHKESCQWPKPPPPLPPAPSGTCTLNSSHEELSFHRKSSLSKLIMSLFKKIRKTSPLGKATHPGVITFQCTCVDSLMRLLFSLMLVEIGARKEWKFLEKVIWRLLGSVLQAGEKSYWKQQQGMQGLDLGATRRGGLRARGWEGMLKNLPKVFASKHILYAQHVYSVKETRTTYCYDKGCSIVSVYVFCGGVYQKAACYRAQTDSWKSTTSFS